jgi:subtilisin family serine protease
MRGTSPTANDNLIDGDFDLPFICVGATDVTVLDQKSSYSDCGPGVDIWAPGTSIISALSSAGVGDARNGSYLVGKYSGTSMASPQVCGVLTCALEQNPHWNQEQAKAYILGIAKADQLTETNGGPAAQYSIMSDDGMIYELSTSRFIDLEEWREKQLDKIL